MPLNADIKKLKEIVAEIDMLKIMVESASASPMMKHKGTIASLCIPNKLYLLWEKRKTLQRKLGSRELKLVEMASSCVKGKVLTLKADVDSVKSRLSTES